MTGSKPDFPDPTAHGTSSPAGRASARWLTRNVFAIGMLSLYSDMGHELVTAVLPLFLATFGAGALALGTIEGISDASASLLKLWMSFYSDRIGKRKPMIAIGYLLTALMGTFGFVTAWWQMLVIRAVAWMGRGARGPLRDALLSESVPSTAHGRAFGFEGAMDSLGAVIGPAIALLLIGVISLRHILFISFVPGAITVFIALFILKDIPRKPQPGMKMMKSLRELPDDFWRYAAAVGVFGLGNFAHTLLVLRVILWLTPRYGTAHAGQIGIGFYILHNIVYTAASYPAGALGDRINKKLFLAIGYALFGVMCIGFMVFGHSLPALAFLFVLAGSYIAIVDSMERALAADLLPLERRGTGYGALATVNSVGDLVSSIAVGMLWTYVSSAAGFFYGAVLTLLGAVALFTIRK